MTISLGSASRVRLQGARSRVRPTRSDKRFQTIPEAKILDMLLLGGWVFEIEAGSIETARAKSKEALEGWLTKGLSCLEAENGDRLFDPVEVINFVKWSGLQGEDQFWADRYIRTGRRLVESLSGKGQANGPPDFASANRLQVHFSHRRSFDLSPFKSGSSVRLRLPLPAPGPEIEVLSIEPVVPSELGASVNVKDTRMEVRLAASDQPNLTLGADLVFVLPAGSTAFLANVLTPEERALYLRPNEGMIKVTARIETLARELVGASPEPRVAVDRFWRFMIDELACGMVRYADLSKAGPCDFVLDQGWYDCQIGSAFLAGLCRASGIPARMVGGNLLYPLAPTNHYWAEVWFEGQGWRSFDFLNWDLSNGGQDPLWRDVFAGRIDQRLVNERLPLQFTGSMSVHFPDTWQMIQNRAEEGIEIAYTDAEDGSLIYRDHITVQLLASVST